jgi:hypothetical protein
MSAASNHPGLSFALAANRAAALAVLAARGEAREVLGLPGHYEELFGSDRPGASAMNASAFVDAAARLGSAPTFSAPMLLLAEQAMRLEATPQGSLARGGGRLRFPVESLADRRFPGAGGFFLIGPGEDQAGLARAASRQGDTVWAWGLGAQTIAWPEAGEIIHLASDDLVWTRDAKVASQLRLALDLADDWVLALDLAWRDALDKALGSKLSQSRALEERPAWDLPAAWPAPTKALTFSPRQIEDLVRFRLGLPLRPPPATRAPEETATETAGPKAPFLPALGAGFYPEERNGTEIWRWLGPDAETTFFVTPAWPGWRRVQVEILSLVPALKGTCVRLFWNGALVDERRGPGLLGGPVWVWPKDCGAPHTVTLGFEGPGQRLNQDPRLLTGCIAGLELAPL